MWGVRLTVAVVGDDEEPDARLGARGMDLAYAVVGVRRRLDGLVHEARVPDHVGWREVADEQRVLPRLDLADLCRPHTVRTESGSAPREGARCG